jgi:hypothetical protein
MLKTISTITNAIGALNYKGTWNASTNTPTLVDGTGAKGDYYVVSTAGTQTFDGVQLFFGLGDWIVYNGAVWQRVEGGSDGNFSNVTLTSTDAGATAAPLLDLYRDSASPAASDTLGEIEFNGEDSAGNKQQYAVIHASILSPTSTAEQGQIHFETATAGALTEKMIIGTTNLVINEIGAVYNVRIESDGDANLFYTDGTNNRIGVGTISPDALLTVNTIASFGAGAVATPSIAAKGDLDTGVWFPAANTMAASTGGSERMRIDSSGQVGIGTTTPGYLLNVSRNGGGGDAAQIARITDTSTSNSIGPLHLTVGATNHFAGNAGMVLAGTNGIGLAVGDGSDLAGQRRLTIDSSGIVTMSAYGAGAATFSSAGVISSVSDETWKIKDGVPVDPDSMLKKLSPGYWYYNDEKKETFGIDRQLGFYAQNVNAAIGPEAAPTPEEGKPWGYYDRSVLAITVMSLQKALATIESLTARIETLEAK